MSLPPLNPDKSVSGISVNPRTLDRIVAPTKRSDGTVRKELKIRPGFTPQEDVSIFRPGRLQVAAGPRTIPGAAPGSSSEPPKKSRKERAAEIALKAAAKPTPKKEKKVKPKPAEEEPVKDSWDDEDAKDEGSSAEKTTGPLKDAGDADVDIITAKLADVDIGGQAADLQ